MSAALLLDRNAGRDHPPVVRTVPYPRLSLARTAASRKAERSTTATPEPAVVELPRLSLSADATAEPGAPLPYLARAVRTDILVIGLVVALSVQLTFGAISTALAQTRVDGLAVALAVALVWVLALALNGAWAAPLVGTGSGEYRRILNVSSAVFGALIIASYTFQADLLRGCAALLIPSATASLIGSRALSRIWLRQQRGRGQYMDKVLVIGSRTTAAALAEHLQRSPHEGYLVTGLCVPAAEAILSSATDSLLLNQTVPVVGDFSDVAAAIQRSQARVVAVTPADGFGPQQVRELAWQLEGTGVRLVLAPGLTDVAGTRIHVAPVAGLSLVHVAEPQFGGSKLVAKTLLDRLGALFALLVLSPLMAVAAIAIKLEDHGPVFFRQERVGLGGTTFRMWKFRSMSTDAERRLTELRNDQDAGNGVLFKLKHDPRITRVGAYLRKFSIDELPQLLNVLTGNMSLVGPRPPLFAESEAYERHVHRRFLVKPGMTGLWQVSGRSNLSWDESVRLDLYYVENWSLAGDLHIMARTVLAVLARRGAY